MVVIYPNQNVSLEDKQGSFIGGVSTAPSLAIGYMYTRGAQYSCEGRILLTILKLNMRHEGCLELQGNDFGKDYRKKYVC